MDNPKFFRFPFAANGDKSSIEDTIQDNGSISYAEGYGYDYERNPATDPQAKRIERDKMNQIHHDITNNIRQYQLYGVPWFYDATYNGGNAIPYAKGAVVRFNDGICDNIYCSLVDNNTTAPTDLSKWVVAEQQAYGLQDGSRNFAKAEGTADALTANITPSPAALTAGMTISIATRYNNKGAATLNLNGFGAKSILYTDGAALSGNDWNANSIISLIYDGINSWRIITSQAYVNNSINSALSTKQEKLENIATINFGSNYPESTRSINFFQPINNMSRLSALIKRNSGENGSLAFEVRGQGNIEFIGNGTITYNNNKIWYGGSQNFYENGFQILPNGMIWQWGKIYTLQNDEVRHISLPIAFPHSFLNVTCSFETIDIGDGFIQAFSLRPTSLSSMEMMVEYFRGNMTHNGFWQAIGY